MVLIAAVTIIITITVIKLSMMNSSQSTMINFNRWRHPGKKFRIVSTSLWCKLSLLLLLSLFFLAVAAAAAFFHFFGLMIRIPETRYNSPFLWFIVRHLWECDLTFMLWIKQRRQKKCRHICLLSVATEWIGIPLGLNNQSHFFFALFWPNEATPILMTFLIKDNVTNERKNHV